MHQLIAYCGLNCAECEAFQATQADDDAWKEKIAAKWRVEYQSPQIDIHAATCDGCRSPLGRAGGYCAECPLRACGARRGVETCAHCAEFETCRHLAEFYQVAPQMKATLEEIRRLL
jgi:hypothetical protein